MVNDAGLDDRGLATPIQFQAAHGGGDDPSRPRVRSIRHARLHHPTGGLLRCVRELLDPENPRVAVVVPVAALPRHSRQWNDYRVLPLVWPKVARIAPHILVRRRS